MGHKVSLLAPCSKNRPVQDISNLHLVDVGSAVPWPAAGSITRLWISIWKESRLKDSLFNSHYDVVHIHEPMMPFLSVRSAYLAKCPLVGTFHAYNEGVGKAYVLFKPLFGNAINKLKARIAVSEAALRYVNSYFPGEYQVVPNGVDISRFSVSRPRSKLLKDSSINLLFVGRAAEPRKGFQYLLGAYSILKWKYHNLRLIVAGSEATDSRSERLMAERGINDVLFTGVLPPEDLAALYQHADIFCAPNTGRESFGMILCEALAAGIPVVASNISGFRNVVKDGEQALLVPPKNEHALAQALERLIQNPSLRSRLSNNGKTHVEKFRWSKIAEEISDIYESVIRKTTVIA